MTPLEKFNQKDKARISAKIYRYFESFKEFICCQTLPSFKIQYVDSRTDKTIRYKAQILPYQIPIMLKYNIAELEENSEDFKATLVHEFTHLYDYHIQSDKYDNEFLKRNLYLYTEYHAVQIEILFCYHIVEKITDYAEIMKVDFDKWTDLPIKKNEIYMHKAIEYYSPDRNKYAFHTLETAYMYACGASAILSHLMNRELKILKFIEPYREEMNEIVRLLLTIKYDEVPSGELLKQIGDINAHMIAQGLQLSEESNEKKDD